MGKKLNVLAVGAHFDDVEIGCGGTIAKHVARGDNVYILVLSNIAYYDRLKKLRKSKQNGIYEGRNAAKTLGVKGFICLNYPKRLFETPPDLIEKLEQIISEKKIDTVYCHWINDVHQDHRIVARAIISAARNIPRVLMYRSNWYVPSEPFKEDLFVNITPFIDKKIEAIKEHKTEIKRKPEIVDFVLKQNMSSGSSVGVKYAESFQIVKYLIED